MSIIITSLTLVAILQGPEGRLVNQGPTGRRVNLYAAAAMELAQNAGTGKLVAIEQAALEPTPAPPKESPSPAAETPADDTEPTPPFEPAEKVAIDRLHDAGLELGYDPEHDRFVTLGLATVAARPDHPAYGDLRAVAFEQALLLARAEVASSFGLAMEYRLTQAIEEPPTEATTIGEEAPAPETNDGSSNLVEISRKEAIA